MTIDTTEQAIIVAALYRFAELPDYARLRTPLQDLCITQDVYGTILLSEN